MTMSITFKLPTQITVLGTVFQVKEDKSMDPEDYGETDGKAMVIRLNPAHKNSYKQTFTHELVHASFAVSGLTEILDPKMEEAIAVCIENALQEYINIGV